MGEGQNREGGGWMGDRGAKINDCTCTDLKNCLYPVHLKGFFVFVFFCFFFKYSIRGRVILFA